MKGDLRRSPVLPAHVAPSSQRATRALGAHGRVTFFGVPWLLRDDQVLASLEVATSRTDRRRGLLGRDGIEGALLIERARSVHTLGMRFPIDVAHLDGDGTVLRTRTMRRNRIGMPVLSARAVLEAEAGCFERWSLTVGDVVEVRTGERPT